MYPTPLRIYIKYMYPSILSIYTYSPNIKTFISISLPWLLLFFCKKPERKKEKKKEIRDGFLRAIGGGFNANRSSSSYQRPWRFFGNRLLLSSFCWHPKIREQGKPIHLCFSFFLLPYIVTNKHFPSQLVFVVFTPCIMFANLAETVTLQDIISWYALPHLHSSLWENVRVAMIWAKLVLQVVYAHKCWNHLSSRRHSWMVGGQAAEPQTSTSWPHNCYLCLR